MILGVELSDGAYNELLLGLLIFLLNPLVVLPSQLGHVLKHALQVALLFFEVTILE